VSARIVDDEVTFQWIKAEPQLAEDRRELESIARSRLILREAWLDKLAQLADDVKQWAEELGWATRLVDKSIEDSEIGNYRAPGVLMQQESVRLYLEPISRTAPGTEGVVDLYVMPSYDDVASIYYYDNQWNLHYAPSSPTGRAQLLETEARPLTKETLREVFDQMKAHAS
jgi:hypothetical protein